MANIKEIIVTAVIPMLKAVGKAQLAEILSKIQTNNTPEVYANTLKSIYSSFTLLDEVAVKTKTKIDDGLIDLVLEAVTEAAEEDGITL